MNPTRHLIPFPMIYSLLWSVSSFENYWWEGGGGGGGGGGLTTFISYSAKVSFPNKCSKNAAACGNTLQVVRLKIYLCNIYLFCCNGITYPLTQNQLCHATRQICYMTKIVALSGVFTCRATLFECLRQIYLSLRQSTTYLCMTSKSCSLSYSEQR